MNHLPLAHLTDLISFCHTVHCNNSENLPSTTDRDLCIRLCDYLSGSPENWFSSTNQHTVIHYADADRERVSSRGSPAKIQGLKKFYHKYSPRMSDTERMAYKERAANLFGCGEEEFLGGGLIEDSTEKKVLESWSGERLALNRGTIKLLPKFPLPKRSTENKRVIFGTITSDTRRISPLLDDLHSASLESHNHGFDPFIVIFVNGMNTELVEEVEIEVNKRNLQGHVFSRQSCIVDSILEQCNEVQIPFADEILPIALSRSVLQVFIYNLPHLQHADAVCIIDDDKRLIRGWTPFTENEADILIGRDLRTPPNPSVFSLRTNLIDLLYSLDLVHAEGSAKEDVKSFCLSQTYQDTLDWYYDLSSSRMDHLEMPVYSSALQVDVAGFGKQLLNDFLVGTPLCRDVIPPSKSEATLQRGGCMVIMNRNINSFEPLALQQHAPKISFSDCTTSYSRRSDSFWCKQMKDQGVTVAVDEQLYVYHDNQFDVVSSPSNIKKNIVQELMGGILCRNTKWRDQYKETRLLELKAWLFRVKGLLISLRNRPYCNDELDQEFIEPLEQILDTNAWEDEVFSIVRHTFSLLKAYKPNPTNFAMSNNFLKLDIAETKEIEKEWNSARINQAHKVLRQVTGKEGYYIGIGGEGVSFRINDSLYKVFDLNHSRLPKKVTKLLHSSYLDDCSDHQILKRHFVEGASYRGGHGLALVTMLRQWKDMNLYHKNLTPDNLVLDKNEQMLRVVDIGRDVFYQESEYLYRDHFQDMCKRAYLCFRFGGYANNPYSMVQLKQWMREDYSSVHLIGFENFMRHVYDAKADGKGKLYERLHDLEATCGHVISTVDNGKDDKEVIKQMNEAISHEVKCHRPRVAVVIEDPFHDDKIENDYADIQRRPLWFYRRHLRRFGHQLSFSIEDEQVFVIDPATFKEYVGYHIFILDFGSPSPSNKDACFLMIKSCPLEYQSIYSDVRRTIFSLESSTSFKSIVLVADISKVDGFIRQYASTVDINAYMEALDQIQDERLVDSIVKFDGKNTSEVLEVNKRWLGINVRTTHSSLGQHYTSTFVGFECISEHELYCKDDIVLQMDSDIIIHSESGKDDILECISYFQDPQLLSFAFPTLSSNPLGCGMKHLNQGGKPLRFEIRCSFVHLDRMTQMLPFQIPAEHLVSSDSTVNLKKGWWHILDYNVQSHAMKSCRGTVADGKNLWFIHPPNEFKKEEMIIELCLVSDILSSNHMTVSILEKKSAWRKQLNKVNLQSIGREWLLERHESIVVAIDISDMSYGTMVYSLDSLMRTRARLKMFQSCGVVLFDNGSISREDIIFQFFLKSRERIGITNLSTISWSKKLSTQCVQLNLRSMCINSNSLVFISKGKDCFDLHNTVCLLPYKPLKFCSDCGSYYDDTVCHCYDDVTARSEFNATSLPCSIPSVDHRKSIQLLNTKLFASESIVEGKLNIEISALVSGLDHIKDAENVCVRIHSECLSGDVFYSMKCDCGLEKLKFLHVMAEKEELNKPCVFVYIKGHEGRGAGLYNKVKAYKQVENNPDLTHIDALHEVGCESDIRQYDASVRFIKHGLKVKSICLFTNNPGKIKAARKYFGCNVSVEPMPAVPSLHNKKYLEEKSFLLGHKGLLE